MAKPVLTVVERVENVDDAEQAFFDALSDESTLLESALVEKKKGFLTTFGERMSKYKAFLETSRVLFTLLAAAPHYPERPLDVRMSEAGEEVYRLLQEEEKNSQALEQKTEKNEKTEALKRLEERIESSSLDSVQKFDLLTISPYLLKYGLSVEEGARLVRDRSAYEEAYISLHRELSFEERQDLVTSLSGVYSGIAMDMNLKKGQMDRFHAADSASENRLYAMLAIAGKEMRPSTADGVFDRMFIKMLRNERSSTDLLSHVGGLEFKSFLATASARGRAEEFLKKVGTETERLALVETFVSVDFEHIKQDQIGAIAQVIIHEKDSSFGAEIKQMIKEKYTTALASGDEKALTVYGYLSSVYGNESANWLTKEHQERYGLEFQEKLSVNELFDENGIHTQLYYFYNDEDGDYSFQHFLEQNADWEIQDLNTYVVLRKITPEGRTIEMYANKPTFAKNGEKDRLKEFELSDVKPAIDIIKEQLKEKGQVIHTEVHRGHAYWSRDTANDLSKETKLYFDGSCGGSATTEWAVENAPNAQLIYNSHEGMAVINDATLKIMNARLLDGKDLIWKDIREEAKDSVTQSISLKTTVADWWKGRDTKAIVEDRFADYYFPDMEESAGHVVGSVVLKSLSGY